MDISNFLENTLLDLTLNSTAYAQPAIVYLALLTDLSDDGDTFTEVTAGDYARQIIVFGVPAAGVAKNNATISWPNPLSQWGTITHVAIFDSITGGNVLFYDEFAFPVTVFQDAVVNTVTDNLIVSIAGGTNPDFRNDILNTVLRNTAFSAASGHVGLLTALSDEGESFTEVAGSGYSRVSLSAPAAALGSLSNDVAVEFSQATSDYSDTVKYIGVFDAAAAGNLRYWFNKPSAETVLEGQIFRIPLGELTITFD